MNDNVDQAAIQATQREAATGYGTPSTMETFAARVAEYNEIFKKDTDLKSYELVNDLWMALKRRTPTNPQTYKDTGRTL